MEIGLIIEADPTFGVFFGFSLVQNVVLDADSIDQQSANRLHIIFEYLCFPMIANSGVLNLVFVLFDQMGFQVQQKSEIKAFTILQELLCGVVTEDDIFFQQTDDDRIELFNQGFQVGSIQVH